IRDRNVTGVQTCALPIYPPARYTEASLVKKMEDLGIGRPFTYASIIKTIQDRGYVVSRGNALVPSWVAFAVVGLLESHFTELVEIGRASCRERWGCWAGW